MDGIARKLDAVRTMQLISPRRHQAWSASYKARAARLEAEGRMAGPGRAAIAASKREGGWETHAEVDALQVPEDLERALDQALGARAYFDAAPPSYRRNVLRWVAAARRSETRARRMKTVANLSAARERILQM